MPTQDCLWDASEIVYTGLLNDQGGYESDLTIVRSRRDEFYLITGTAQPLRDAHWIRSQIGDKESVEVVDVSALYGVLSVMGPESRTFLQPLCDISLDAEAFPFGVAKEISVGKSVARALRVTYVGELGWELHIPADQLGSLFDTVVRARGDGVCLAGHYAIQSLRLEKAYRA